MTGGHAWAQESPAAVPAAPSPAPTPANSDAAIAPAPEATPAPASTTAPATNATPAKPPAPPARLTAPRVHSEGNLVIAESSTEIPVRLETVSGVIIADRVELDTAAQTLKATGHVHWERESPVRRKEMRARNLHRRYYTDNFQESASGENLNYDFKAREGQFENAEVILSSFTIRASQVEINGKKYTAHNVIVIPGGLTAQERKIYGTPPFSLHAHEVTAIQGDKPGTDTLATKGGGLYFHKTRILPVPSYLARTIGTGGGKKDPSDPSIMPTLGYNSTDGLLVTTKFRFPMTKDGRTFAALADIGLSERIGLRGGADLQSQTSAGQFNLWLRRNDIVTTQLTNRIELDREPEFNYSSPNFGLFDLPGGRKGGFRVKAGIGEFEERTIGDDAGSIRSSRATAGISFSTRVVPRDGIYLELFANDSDYSKQSQDYRNLGFEFGYEGNILDRVRGQISYRSNSLSGDTPFRFDRIEIAKELRSTFDVKLTPRYLIPVDLRYDLNRNAFRDKTVGLLRSYKTFAYGVVYQQARRDLRFEVREGF